MLAASLFHRGLLRGSGHVACQRRSFCLKISDRTTERAPLALQISPCGSPEERRRSDEPIGGSDKSLPVHTSQVSPLLWDAKASGPHTAFVLVGLTSLGKGLAVSLQISTRAPFYLVDPGYCCQNILKYSKYL